MVKHQAAFSVAHAPGSEFVLPGINSVSVSHSLPHRSRLDALPLYKSAVIISICLQISEKGTVQEKHAPSCYGLLFSHLWSQLYETARRKCPLKPEPSSVGTADLWQLPMLGLFELVPYLNFGLWPSLDRIKT